MLAQSAEMLFWGGVCLQTTADSKLSPPLPLVLREEVSIASSLSVADVSIVAGISVESFASAINCFRFTVRILIIRNKRQRGTTHV